MTADAVPALLRARRSIRAFTPDPVTPALLDACVRAACLAPAPHHSRPWRFAVLGAGTLGALADAMGQAWRADLDADGVAPGRVESLVARSRERICAAPAGILACLTRDGLDPHPDERRRGAEWTLGVLSLGAAVENLMLAATDAGLATCWIAAPAFCPEAAAAALDLPGGLTPQALVLCGHPDPAHTLPPRPDVDLDSLRLHR